MHVHTKNQDKTSLVTRLLPLVCAVLIIAEGSLTALAYARSQQIIDKQIQNSLEKITSGHIEELLHSMETYGDILYATRGLFAATTVDARTWDNYVHAQSAPNRYAGMQAVGYAEIVPPANLTTYEQTLQTTQLRDIAIHPKQTQAEHVILTYHEEVGLSATKLRDAIGFDLATNPVRSDALHRAQTTGKMTATNRINLTTTDKPGFLLILPLTNKFGSTASQTFGYGIAAFEFSALVENTMGPRLDSYKTSVSVQDVTDGTPIELLSRKRTDSPDHFITSEQTVQVADRVWKITFETPKNILLIPAQRLAPVAVLAIGFGFMTATSILAYALRLRSKLKMSL